MCVSVVLEPQVGWGGVEFIHWDPQLGGINCRLMNVNIFLMVVLCIYPHNFTCVIINLLISAYVKVLVNKVVHSMRAH